jgi:hypothetical protein
MYQFWTEAENVVIRRLVGWPQCVSVIDECG